MKITNYIIVMITILVVGFMSIQFNIKRTQTAQEVLIKYNTNIDNASREALANIVVADDGTVHINEDEIIDDFYNSMYASFGLLDDVEAQERFLLYLPVIALVENDGFYLRYNVTENGHIRSVWSPKYPYSYKGIGYSINFRLDDTVQFMTSNAMYEGKYNELLNLYKESRTIEEYTQFKNSYLNSVLCTNSGNDYKSYKQSAIADNITKYMQHYIEENNIIAKNYGIAYRFSLPNDANSELSRSITDISLISIFQGYSDLFNTDQYYSKMSVSGARIYKSTPIYARRNSKGILYYHEESCKVDNSSLGQIYYTNKEAAEAGALPCPYCRP